MLLRKILSGIPLESNGLDPVQDQHSVSPNLDPNCLQRLSADAASKERVKFSNRTIDEAQVFRDTGPPDKSA